MTRRRYIDRDGRFVDASVALDARGVLKDGFGLRTPMQFMDAEQREVARDARRRKVTQRDPMGRVASTYEEEEDAALSDAALASHRPGYRSSVAVNDDEAVKAYNEYVRSLTDSWRTTDQPAPHIGPRAGDPCMTDDKRPGRWVREGDAMVCRATQRTDAVPAGPVFDAVEGQRLKDEAWQQMVDEQREAWRKR